MGKQLSNFMGIFNNKKPTLKSGVVDFGYLDSRELYFDSACQTLRPQPVIDAMTEYFQGYNACGGRVKYDWGKKVDEKILETRKQILALLGKSDSEYVVAFTLNTSYGINLVLSQLPSKFKKVVTSEIEHNSVFLPAMEAAKRLGVFRVVLPRSPDGALEYKPAHLSEAVIVLNSMSNIDGRALVNLQAIVRDAHQAGGIVLIDAAQGIGHDQELLRRSDFDALFFSGHKFYGPSLGVIVIKRSLLKALDVRFIGGGMVEDVKKETYKLVSSDEDLPALLEIGLQDFAGIIGLGASIKWHESYKPEGQDRQVHQAALSRLLFERLAEMPTVRLINFTPSPIVSFYSEKIDAHRLAIYLSAQNIMARSGYFCCHYYLKNLKKYPPLLRVSLGLHNTRQQAESFLQTLETIILNA